MPIIGENLVRFRRMQYSDCIKMIVLVGVRYDPIIKGARRDRPDRVSIINDFLLTHSTPQHACSAFG